MADLEESGFVASPHTSAGRVPTPKGYRFFVDSLIVVKPLEQQEIHRLEGELVADRPQQLVNTAAQLLSQLTQFAGVVMTPRREPGLRHLEFLRLGDRRVLLIVVTSDYHMPRALAELKDAAPGAEIVPWAVPTARLQTGAWWRDAEAVRLIAVEYVKYLRTLARQTVDGSGDHPTMLARRG